MTKVPTILSARRAGLAIFLVALALRLAWVLTLPNALAWPDEVDFADIARALASGHGYVSQSFRANPVLPFYLSLVFRLFGEQYVVARIGQTLLGALTCVLIYRTAAILASPLVGVLSGLALAFYLPHIFVAGVFYVDAFLTFFFALAVYLAVRAVRDGIVGQLAVTACGIVLGVTVLARPIFAVCLPALGLAWIVQRGLPRRRRLVACLVLTGATVVPIVPWVVRDYVVHGHFLPISSGFFTKLWQGNNELSAGDADDRELRWDTDVWQRRLAEVDPVERAAIERRYATVDREVRALEAQTHDAYLASDRVLRPLALAYIRDHPRRTAELFWKKLLTLYSAFTPTIVQNEFTSDRNRWLAALSFYPVLALALLGMLVGLRDWRALAPIYLVVFAVSAAYSLLNTCMRFRLPLDPYLIVFAALAAVRLWQACARQGEGNEVELEVFEETRMVAGARFSAPQVPRGT